MMDAQHETLAHDAAKCYRNAQSGASSPLADALITRVGTIDARHGQTKLERIDTDRSGNMGRL
jgi:hypothetical protein